MFWNFDRSCLSVKLCPTKPDCCSDGISGKTGGDGMGVATGRVVWVDSSVTEAVVDGDRVVVCIFTSVTSSSPAKSSNNGSMSRAGARVVSVLTGSSLAMGGAGVASAPSKQKTIIVTTCNEKGRRILLCLNSNF